jgi:SAM-dependent methyltransferase
MRSTEVLMADFYDPIAYDAGTAGVPGDIDFFLELAKESHAAGLPVLELACGTGRVAIPIAQAGVRVVGLDLNKGMLDRAREKSVGLSTASWVEGDMRSFAIEERFGLIYIPARSFQHLLTVADQHTMGDSCVPNVLSAGRHDLHRRRTDG